MQDKLQELTDKLYNEGLSKGKEEGQRLLDEAKAKAEAIVAEAREQAEQIVEAAKKNAAELKTKAESDIRSASAQALQATRKDIENILLEASCKSPVKAELRDTALLQEVITETARHFSPEAPCDLALVLPENLRGELEDWVSGKLAKTLDRGVSATFSKKMAGGFRIGPADGSWYVNFSDESFSALIAEYLRPVTRKLLFGE
jgi:V/A-type H+-transporting ATPase subunit E